MGYVLSNAGLQEVIHALGEQYQIYAPVLKKGEGRFTDTDVVRYDFITEAKELELSVRSDYAGKEILTPLSETLFFFTQDTMQEAKPRTEKDVLVFLRSCDMHAIKRCDQIYLGNGKDIDTFYQRIRDKVHFVLIGCSSSCDDGFCVDMHTNQTTEGFLFSINQEEGGFACDVKDEALDALFATHADTQKDAPAAYVTENAVHVSIPETIPNSIYKSNVWDEYSTRCIGCGRCNFVCPTCTCYTMQDIYYTDNGQVGERRRVAASCMVDGYTNVAGGGQYRRTKGERMRFKVLHKIHDFRKRFGYDMCVGCGRCDAICPEYISFSACLNKLDKAVKEEADA